MGVTTVETFEIGGHEYPNTLSADVKVNQGDLAGDFENHPQRFAYWATLYELALDEEIRLKRALERVYAQVDHGVRQEGKAAGVRLTEKMVENSVITHPNYRESLQEYHDAKLTAGLIKASRDAMIHRRDMLIQLGATHRAEGVSDISIRDKESTARDVVGKR